MTGLFMDKDNGLCVIGHHGALYSLVSPDPAVLSVIDVIDVHVANLHQNCPGGHPDIDILLDARLEIESR